MTDFDLNALLIWIDCDQSMFVSDIRKNKKLCARIKIPYQSGRRSDYTIPDHVSARVFLIMPDVSILRFVFDIETTIIQS